MKKLAMEVQSGGAPPPRPSRARAETHFGVALVDRHGNLLAASLSNDLPGEVEVPCGTNLRARDLRAYFGEEALHGSGRAFPLVSATWVQVKSRRIRVGIYMEKGETSLNPECLDLDVGAVSAIIATQVLV